MIAVTLLALAAILTAAQIAAAPSPRYIGVDD